jgi:hypothetical protein
MALTKYDLLPNHNSLAISTFKQKPLAKRSELIIVLKSTLRQLGVPVQGYIYHLLLVRCVIEFSSTSSTCRPSGPLAASGHTDTERRRYSKFPRRLSLDNVVYLHSSGGGCRCQFFIYLFFKKKSG